MTADSQLIAELENLLLPETNPGGRITGVKRRRSEYSSSFPIERVEVTFQNRVVLPIIFKNLALNSIMGEARDVKHRFLLNPEREIRVYRSILSHDDLGTAKHYGSVVDRGKDRYWLFIERVPGLEMYQIGEFESWRQVARWLAAMHAKFIGRTKELQGKAPLLRYDRDYYQLWPQRAVAHARHKTPGIRALIEKLLVRYDRVIDRLLQLPETLLHGDFYASNILAQPLAGSLRICPVDWDMAAIGPGFTDLAALISGQWTETESDDLIKAYLGRIPTDDTRMDIACCQLHLAIQWLGWSPSWRPPQEHQQDWISQAVNLVESIDL